MARHSLVQKKWMLTIKLYCMMLIRLVRGCNLVSCLLRTCNKISYEVLTGFRVSTYRLISSIVFLPCKMILLLQVYLSTVTLGLNCLVLRCLWIYCMPINLQTVGLRFLSRFMTPRGLLVVFYLVILERVAYSYQDSAAIRVIGKILVCAHIPLTAGRHNHTQMIPKV